MGFPSLDFILGEAFSTSNESVLRGRGVPRWIELGSRGGTGKPALCCPRYRGAESRPRNLFSYSRNGEFEGPIVYDKLVIVLSQVGPA